MAMAALNISIPPSVRAFVDDQVVKGNYPNASEYVRELIEADQHRSLRVELEGKLLAASRQPSREMMPKEWDAIAAKGRQILDKNKIR
jgi:antitoxin ParD1/3/4